MDIKTIKHLLGATVCSAGLLLSGCGDNKQEEVVATNGTCSGTYPSYWQDPAFQDQWVGQKVSNVPPADWTGPVYQ
ncbi:MAG: hypothetical protein QF808_08135, partial [Thalassolituus sp.]|nr:hypothetical protein [Thalassolituus sp.]